MCVCNWRVATLFVALDDDVAAVAGTVAAAAAAAALRLQPPVLRSFIVGPLTRTRLWRAHCTFSKVNSQLQFLLHFSYMLQFIFPLSPSLCLSLSVPVSFLSCLPFCQKVFDIATVEGLWRMAGNQKKTKKKRSWERWEFVKVTEGIGFCCGRKELFEF